MNRHALVVLQYPEALDLVAGHASSPLGAEAVRSRTPSDAAAWVEAELGAVAEMMAFLQEGDGWIPPAIPDLRAALRLLAIPGSVWEGPALRDAAELIRSARTTRRAVLRLGASYPRLAEVAGRLAVLEDEEAAVRRAVDEAGEVRDDATKELARLRRELRSARARIVERLERFMASLPERYRVADASITIREGRYVVPIRREGRSEVGGIVHDESATGGTLFVEPPLALELMNRLRELELAEAREVQRILRELTDGLRPHRAALSESLDALVELDSLFARARYALRFDGHRPELLPAGSPEYRVVNGRHPLLLAAAEAVVPFDLALDEGERTLLVSGPNTGGKTVLLKAIGLTSLLAQSGVIPPVGAGTRLPLFRNVFADIGDEQSIEASLSTFSAHLKNLGEIVEEADGDALALIDEIGSGTDPAEGAALARAILVELTGRGTLTVATTHLGDLKRMAGDVPGVVNASLQFDSRELRPTYRLLKGVPGRSYGLAIARRLGFPAAVLGRAEAHVPAAEREAERLLFELEEKERRMSEALAEAERSRAVAEARLRELEERERALRQREREEGRRARQQARDLLLAAREEVEAAIREVREAAVAAAEASELEDAARRARRRVEEAAARHAERGGPERGGRRQAKRGRPGVEDRIGPGVRVRVEATGAAGTVVEIRDGRALVEVGGLRLQVPVDGLAPAGGGEDGGGSGPRRAAARPGGGWQAPEVNASPEVDLRGLRVDEVEGRLVPALDAAVQAGLASLRIIHGKGTGALREVVAGLLKDDPRVRGYRLGRHGEGGAGVTIAELE